MNPEKAQQKWVRIGPENWGWNGGESDKDLYKKKPPGFYLIILQGSYSYFSPARNGRFILWRNSGEKIINKVFLNSKIMSFQTDKGTHSAQHNE